MNLKELFIKVKNEYSRGDFAGNDVANAIRREPEQSIPSSIIPRDKYQIKGSAGQGNWAGIPWITLSNKSISTSAQEGIYLVYVFNSDYSKVYLCLGTGWTYFDKKFKAKKEALQKIEKFARYVRAQLNSVDDGSQFVTDPIDLDPTNKLSDKRLADGYEAGMIYNKRYDINDELNNDELLADLKALEIIFTEVTNQLQISDFVSFERVVEDVVTSENYEIEILEDEKNAKDLDPFAIALQLKVSEAPSLNKPERSGKPGNMETSNRNHVEEADRNTKRGRKGEEIAIEFERMRLEQEGYETHEIEIDDLPKKKRDNAGYDLISIARKNGQEEIRYIEVKTTNGGIGSAFFMSPNELNVREEKGDKYFIYRIYKVSEDAPGIYIIPNDDTMELDKEAVNYAIYPKHIS